MLIERAVPDLPLHVPRSAIVTSMNDRIIASKVKARRQWVTRTALMLGVTGVLLTLMVIWHRDGDAIRASKRSADSAAAAIQDYIDQTGLLPAVLPSSERSAFGYVSYADRFYAQNVSDPVIIAQSATVPLMLRSDGRSVIVYQQGKVRTQWMSAAEFTAAVRGQVDRAAQFEQRRRASVPQLP